MSMLPDDVRHLGNENHNRFVEAEAHERILKSFKRRKYHIDRLTGVAFFSHPVQPHGKRGELKCGRRRRMALRANYRYNKIPPAPPHPSVDRSVGRKKISGGRGTTDETARRARAGAGGRAAPTRLNADVPKRYICRGFKQSVMTRMRTNIPRQRRKTLPHSLLNRHACLPVPAWLQQST